MKPQHKEELLAALAGAREELEKLGQASEAGVSSAAHAFKSFAADAEAVVQKASTIVGCVEKESMDAVLAKVQALCASMKLFLGQRLEAASAVLERLVDQEKLLRELSGITRNQEAIAHHLRALSVLTDVEVARLGNAGGDFHLLAQELAAFSKSLSGQTRELAADNENRKRTLRETKMALATSLPQLGHEMARMEEDMGSTLHAIEDDLSRQASIPAQFQSAARQTSVQVAGVVAAIQAHDITRQQLEHLHKSLGLIASRVTAEENNDRVTAQVHRALKVQLCQLENVRQTVANWTSQIKRCMSEIQQLSASEMMTIGPAVLQQERELSSQLVHIERLQEKSREYTGQLRETLSGLSSLVELVNEHLRRSQTILDRLQLLMFNSLVEAHRLSSRGAVVSAIANLIRGVSQEWRDITERSRHTLDGMLNLVSQIDRLMEAFSEGSDKRLREDEEQTGTALGAVRDSAAIVAKEAGEMQSIVRNMQGNLGVARKTENELDASFVIFDVARTRIEGGMRALEGNECQPPGPYDAAEIEEWFGPLYTTEIERDVMRAALHGTAMPVLQESFAGNSVELF